jgi:hypothetical protein
MGGPEYAVYFLVKNRGGGQIYVFEVPSWMEALIDDAAIKQKNATLNPLYDRGITLYVWIHANLADLIRSVRCLRSG